MERREELMEKLIEAEFAAFDKARNKGGRAACQNDWTTFHIMRSSQYMTWTEEMLESFLADFETAGQNGRNLIAEKYARMMKSTAPQEYAALEGQLPALTPEAEAIIEQVVQIQVGWMERFAAEHPNVAMNARYIHTAEDTADETSAETYLRGELGTYSEHTLYLYARFIVSLWQQGRNLTEMIMQNTIAQYGYQSFDEVS